MAHGPRSRWARIALGVLAAVGTILLFVIALVTGVILHVGTPAARRVAVRQVNALLAPSFKGTIRIDSLGGLGLWGISGGNVTIDDPTGQPVIVARGARVRLGTWTAFRSALFDKSGPLDIVLANVVVDSVDVRLDTDPQGNLYLVDAFASPKPPSPPDPNARGLRLEIPHITLTHGWAHGQMAGAPPLDVHSTTSAPH